MKPFDLKAALAGVKVVTRSGVEVVEFHDSERAADLAADPSRLGDKAIPIEWEE